MNTFQKAKNEKKKSDILKGLPFRQWWLLYVGVGIIAMLSTFAGGYLGLSPDSSGQIVYSGTWDLISKILFCIFYMVMFFITAEAALLFWLDKLMLHDVDERHESVKIQLWVSWSMLAVSLLTMIITAVAASEILAAWRNSFDGTANFPEWTQGWILGWIPALIILHVVCAILYKQSTAEAQLERYRRAKMREARINALDAGTNEYVAEFNRLAPDQAKAAYRQKAKNDAETMKAEIGLYDQELKSGQDINGDGVIGDPRRQNFNQPARSFAQETETLTIVPVEEDKNPPTGGE